MEIPKSFSIRNYITSEVMARGGWVNAHSHPDRAYTLTQQDIIQSGVALQAKWTLVDDIKRRSTVEDYYQRMARYTDNQKRQGVAAVGYFIDVDTVAVDKVVRAARQVRDNYPDIQIRYINQTLKGVMDPEAWKWVKLGARFVDILGSLPAKDAGKEEQHIDRLMELAKNFQTDTRPPKMLHVHVDQNNHPDERESEMVVRKTVEHGLQGRVALVHGISIAAQEKSYRFKLYEQMVDAGVMVIACPSAWLDGPRSEVMAPTHNSVTPIDEMAEVGVTVALGADNVEDLYCPDVEGDMYTEAQLVFRACRYRNVPKIIEMCTINGYKALDLTPPAIPLNGHHPDSTKELTLTH